MSSFHVQTLANSIIGTAILAMPYCFSKVKIQSAIIKILEMKQLSLPVRRNSLDFIVNYQHSRHKVVLSLPDKSQHRDKKKKHGAAWLSHVRHRRQDDGRNLGHWVLDGNMHRFFRRHRRPQSAHHCEDIQCATFQPRLRPQVPYHHDNVDMCHSTLLPKKYRVFVVRLSGIDWLLRLPHTQDSLRVFRKIRK